MFSFVHISSSFQSVLVPVFEFFILQFSIRLFVSISSFFKFLEDRRFDCRGLPIFWSLLFFIFRRLSQFSAAVLVALAFSVLAVRPRVSSLHAASFSIQFISSQRFGFLRACPAAVIIWILVSTVLFLFRVRWRRHDLHSVVLACKLSVFRKFIVSIVEFFQFSGFLVPFLLFRFSVSFHFLRFNFQDFRVAVLAVCFRSSWSDFDGAVLHRLSTSFDALDFVSTVVISV